MPATASSIDEVRPAIVGRPAGGALQLILPEAVADLHFPGLHPDAARWLVTERSIDAIGLDWDEFIAHNSLRVIKLTKDGDILIGMPNGQFKAVALADHTHTVPMLVGQATYSVNQDVAARTGTPDQVSKDTKVT